MVEAEKMKDVVVRVARASDYEAVVEMSQGIYEGHDYFPCVFLQWLKKQNRAIFVAELDSKLIGLRALHIVDDGKTFISQGLRIHPNFRGKGLSSHLINSVHEYIRQNYPNVDRERFTTKSDNVERLAIQKKYGDGMIHKQDILAFHVDKDFLCPVTFEDVSGIKLKHYNKADLGEVILDKAVANILFKQGVHIIDWEPFDADQANLEDLVEDSDFMLADRSAGEYIHCRIPPKSFSHGRASPRVEHVHWVVSLYADDPYLYKAHIFEQLKKSCESIKGEFIFSTFHDSTYTSHIKHFLEGEVGLRAVDFFDFGLMLFEKEFS